MADFKKQFPESKPFKCCTAWHLRDSGNLLAVYDFIGGLTNGGKNSFFSSIRKVAIFFYQAADKSHYETIRQAFKTLRVMGFLKKVRTQSGIEWHYVPHDEWASANPKKCQKRDLLPWQQGSDPFVGAIWALSKGKIRLHENNLNRIRQVTTDEEFLEAYKKKIEEAESRRVQGGDWRGTSAKACFWNVYSEFLNSKGLLV